MREKQRFTPLSVRTRPVLPGFLRRWLGLGASYDWPCCARCNDPDVAAITATRCRRGQHLLAWCARCARTVPEPGIVLPARVDDYTWGEIDGLADSLHPVISLADALAPGSANA